MKAAGLALMALGAALAAWFGPAAPLGAAIFAMHPPFLNTLQAGVQRRLAPALWDDLFLPVLEAPAWLAPLLLGAIVMVLGLRRRRHG